MSDITTWLQYFFFAFFAGAIGQVIRQIGTIKKMLEEQSNSVAKLKEVFDTTRFTINLFVGAIAGVIGMLTLDVGKPNANTNLNQLFITLVGVGYAGADFIEAFMRREGKKWEAVTSVDTSTAKAIVQTGNVSTNPTNITVAAPLNTTL